MKVIAVIGAVVAINLPWSRCGKEAAAAATAAAISCALDRKIDLPLVPVARERHDLPGVSSSPSLAHIAPAPDPAAPSDVKL